MNTTNPLKQNLKNKVLIYNKKSLFTSLMKRDFFMLTSNFPTFYVRFVIASISNN